MPETHPPRYAESRLGSAVADRTVAGGAESTCRWCGDPNVVFINRLGAHCPDCYREGLIDQALHEASL